LDLKYVNLIFTVKTALGCWLCFTNLISLLKYISPDQTFYFTLAVIKVLTIMAIINKHYFETFSLAQNYNSFSD